MSSATRRAEFFALEATEYLAELEPLVARNETPDLERLVRGARSLRGAALMAGLGTFARAAAGLEAVARQVRDHALGWETQAHAGWREGLHTLRGLVTRATNWEAADDRQALALADRLERVASGRHEEAPATPAAAATPVQPPAPRSGLTPGVRAFIARESELIATSLLEASRALAPLPPADALTAVLERMRSLRGLGAAGDLSPLPELLEAMEATTRSILTDAAPPPNVAGVFADAADALHAMARSVADEGQVLVPAGLDQIAGRLLQAFTAEHDVVTIDALGYDGESAIADPGRVATTGPKSEPVPIELVGVGDHLRLQAEALDRHASPTSHQLRVFVLHRTLATMPTHGGTGRFLAPLIRSILRAIGAGMATTTPDRFTALLRDAGEFLVGAGSSRDRSALAAESERIARAFSGDAPPPAATPIATAPLAVAEITVSIDSLAPDEVVADVIAIDALAPDDVADDIVTIDALAPDDVANDIVTIDALAPDDVADDIVSIDALAPDAATDDVVSIEALAPDAQDDIVSIDALAPDAHDDIVSIDALAPDTHDDIVSIDTLAPDAHDEIVSIDAFLESPESAESAESAADRPRLDNRPQLDDAPRLDDASSRLERAYRSRDARIRQEGLATPSLEGLAEDDVMPVARLLYRGERALHRAEELRGQIARVLAEPTVSLERLRPLVDELLDLVPLARDAA